jgi:hypothetical protein
MASKRQTTMAKLARERRVQERRILKQEKKQAAAAARLAAAAEPVEGTEASDEQSEQDSATVSES